MPLTRLPSPKKAILLVAFNLIVSLHPLQKYLTMLFPALSLFGDPCWLISGEGLVALEPILSVLTHGVFLRKLAAISCGRALTIATSDTHVLRTPLVREKHYILSKILYIFYTNVLIPDIYP